MPHDKAHMIFGPLMKWGFEPEQRAHLDDPLYKEMVANPDDKAPFLLTEEALAVR